MPRAKYKKRADGRYLSQILIGYQDNGKPKFKNIYGRTIPELENKINEFKAQMNKGIILDDKNLTVREWSNIWLNTYKSGVSYNTNRRYEFTLHKQILPYIGDEKISKIKLVDVQNLINKLANQYSASTLKKVRGSLNQLFKCAIQNHLIYINPVDGVQLPNKQQSEKQFLSESQIEHVTAFCASYKDGIFILTLLYTGMRREEIVPLTWDDVDLEENIITVNKAVEFINNQPNIKPPKTAKSSREIPILDILRPYLIKLKSESDGSLLFCNSKGNMHTETSLRRLWERFMKNYNDYLVENQQESEHFTMHILRHTFATILFSAGVDIKTAQSILGHSTISVLLDIYTHLEQRIKMRGISMLNEYTKQVVNSD